MRTIGELLRAADPIRYERMWSPRERLIVEQRVLAHVHDGPARVWSRRSLIGAAATMALPETGWRQQRLRARGSLA